MPVFAMADAKPSKPVRVVAPIPPESSPDIVGRLIAGKLTPYKPMGDNIIHIP